MFKRILKPFASLRLTVILLALSMILVYAGTWAQVDTGIWQVQKRYFHSFICWVSLRTLLPRPAAGAAGIPWQIGFPMPGGYIVGLFLLINLVAAHTVRFKFTLKRTGIILIHSGLILLLIGEGITSGMAVESQMALDNGGSANWTQDIREVELAVIDPSAADHDNVAAIPESFLKKGGLIHSGALPFDVRVDAFYQNSNLLGPFQAGVKKDVRATAGDGARMQITAVPLPPASGTESDVDGPSAYVTPIVNGKPLDTYLVSLYLDSPQTVDVNGKDYEIALRFKRYYKPYTVHLIKFSHDRYTGTDTAKNFSSLIRLVDPDTNTDREVNIWMNHPLRYGGETFYQASFKKGDKTTILTVVRNPGWLMPYFACAITGLGLAIHFIMTLVIFINRQSKKQAAMTAKPTGKGARASAKEYQIEPESRMWDVVLPLVAAVACIGWLVSLVPAPPPQTFDLQGFSKIPISFEGRIQPLDSLARNALRGISNRETLTLDDTERPAIRWLLDVLANPEKASDYKVFRIDHPDIKSMLGADDSQKYFSLHDLLNNRDKLQEQFKRVDELQTAEKKLDPTQRKLAELEHKVELNLQLTQMETLYLIPPAKPGGDWVSVGEASKVVQQGGEVNPSLKQFVEILDAWHNDKADAFNAAVAAYRETIQKTLPDVAKHVEFEHFYNRFDFFYRCMILYITAFLFVAFSWLGWRGPLWRTGLTVLLITFAVHTLGLVSRIYISGRPPVTNLAASALFIGWGVCLLCLFLEFIYKNGLGIALAAVLGFITLVIAEQLSLDGDNMKVLQAVLDTNFWLATHVVCVTLGYASTFLAGCLGITYVGMGIFNPDAINSDQGKSITRMTYGIVCFAMLFSFVGTILGGIWADQSWGRFWGWDPKENGAVLVVLSNALLLHARWGGLAKARGIALLAIFGNIITSWSWFGTNMLGVGLHSYGFMDSALKWLLLFVGSQVLLIAVGFVPLQFWRRSAA